MLLNKTIRFMDKTGIEVIGPVDKERGCWIDVNSNTYLLHKIKIIEVLPYRFSGINWYHEFANDPVIEISMTQEDHAKNYQAIVYEQKGYSYWAEKDGLVSFYYYTGPENGFAGREFELKMKDGSTQILKGPWSGNYMSMNEVFPKTTCCTIIVPKQGYDFRYASRILAEKAKMLLPPNVFLFDDGTTICPSLSPEKIEKPTL